MYVIPYIRQMRINTLVVAENTLGRRTSAFSSVAIWSLGVCHDCWSEPATSHLRDGTGWRILATEARESSAAATPPLLWGTPANRRPISTPQRVPPSI